MASNLIAMALSIQEKNMKKALLRKALGLQIRLTTGKADVVFLYNESVEGFSRFEGTLPEVRNR